MARIGLFGGSFNPIHNGHVNLALSVKNTLGLDRVIIMPSGTAPHKSCSEYAPPEDRLNMCRLAFEEYEGFDVSDHEILQTGKSYTIYTIRYLKEIYPDDELYLLVGSDMILSFKEWYEYSEILEKTVVAAVSRTGDDLCQLVKMAENLSEYGGCLVINADTVTISSSEIRKMIKNNSDISCYLNEKVVKYIMSKKIYI